MLADYTAMGGVMYLQGESASPLYAVYLWVTIGNGMRYGPRYLFSATALAASSVPDSGCPSDVCARYANDRAVASFPDSSTVMVPLRPGEPRALDEARSGGGAGAVCARRTCVAALALPWP